MPRKPVVCLAGTLDTKGTEYAYVRDALLASDVDVLVVDCGVLGEPYFTPDIPSSEVAARAGVDLADFAAGRRGRRRWPQRGHHEDERGAARGRRGPLRRGPDRRRPRAWAARVARDLLGGALQNLGIGVPKLIVSTMGSNNVRPYVGHSDMMIMNAVTDIAGLNRISKQVLSNAAHAAAGMARGYEATKSQAEASKPLVAISMFGVTTPGVMRIREQLEDNGFEVVTFHAVGEGAGMEHLIDTGAIDALIDYTLPEIINHWNKGIFDPGVRADGGRGPHRHPAGRRPRRGRVLQLRRPGHHPGRVRHRRAQHHHPQPEHHLAAGDPGRDAAARRVHRRARQPGARPEGGRRCPLNGLDNYFKEGSQWHGVDVSPLLDSLRATLDPSIEVVEMDDNINDTAFADAVFELFQKQWAQRQCRRPRSDRDHGRLTRLVRPQSRAGAPPATVASRRTRSTPRRSA